MKKQCPPGLMWDPFGGDECVPIRDVEIWSKIWVGSMKDPEYDGPLLPIRPRNKLNQRIYAMYRKEGLI